MHLKSTYRKYIALLLVVLTLVLLWPEIAGASVISDVAEAAISSVLNRIFNFVFLTASGLLSLLVKTLNVTINIQVGADVPVVASTWKIARDFSNMFFIVIMIVMAFAMIFKVPWLEGYDPGHLIVRFIVAALLINFSLVICGLIIDGTQSVNAIFITAIGDFSDRMGQALNPAQWFGISTKDPLILSPQLFFASVMLFIVDFSLLVALAFTFIRIPFLWLLMILSPLALLGSILPNTRKIYTEWWQKFIGWNLFLPIFLGVLYLGMIFLSQQEQVISSIILTNASSSTSLAGDFLPGLKITMQTLFFYTLVALVFIGGTNAAIKGSLIAGVSTVSGAQWAKTWALRNTGVGAFGKAAEERWKQIQKEGYGRIPGTSVKLYAGEQARGTEFAGRAFGVKGFEQQTLIAKKVGAEKKTLEEEQRSVEELRAIMKSDKGYRGLAAGELLLKDKKLRMGDLKELNTRYGDLKSTIAHKAFRERAQGQLDDMAEKNRLRKKADFDAAFDLVPDGEREAFLGKATKGGVNPVWIAEKQSGINLAKQKKALDDPQSDESKETLEKIEKGDIKLTSADILQDMLEKMTPKDLLKMTPETLGKEPAIQAILQKQLSNQDVSSLHGAASKKHRDALQQIMSKVMNESVDREVNATTRGLNRIRTTLNDLRREFTEVAREIAELEQRAQRPADAPDGITVDQRVQLTLAQQRAKDLNTQLEQLEQDRRKREATLEKLGYRRERYARGDFSSKAVDTEEEDEDEEV